MSSFPLYNMTEDDLEGFANSVKDAIAKQMNLPDLDSHYIVVGKPRLWGRLLDRLNLGREKPFDPNMITIFVMKPVILFKKDNVNE